MGLYVCATKREIGTCIYIYMLCVCVYLCLSLECIYLLVFSEGLESLYMSIVESLYIYVIEGGG
jgi:hypothetical protein